MLSPTPKKILKWNVYRKTERYIPNKLLKNNKHVIICDNFNYNLLNFEHNKFIGNYLNTLNSNLLQSCTIYGAMA